MIELTAEEAEEGQHFRGYLASSGVLEFTTQCACPRSWRHCTPSEHAFKRSLSPSFLLGAVLVALYEEDSRPENTLDFVKVGKLTLANPS